MTDADLPLAPVLIGDWLPSSGYQAGLALAKDTAATAVFVANDDMAVGLIRALLDQGLRVPRTSASSAWTTLPWPRSPAHA